MSVHLVSERASCAAARRLFCPESWDDTALDDPVAAVAARHRRGRAGIPGQVRHREKWRLALDMIEEMAGPGGWGVLEEITTAYDGEAVPQARPYGGLGQPPKPAYPRPPVTVRQLAIAHAAQVRPVTWRQGTKTGTDNPGTGARAEAT